MRSIPSLEAQNRFGELLDTSQREPVLITRRGRPVSLVLSPANDVHALQMQFAKLSVHSRRDVVRPLQPRCSA